LPSAPCTKAFALNRRAVQFEMLVCMLSGLLGFERRLECLMNAKHKRK